MKACLSYLMVCILIVGWLIPPVFAAAEGTGHPALQHNPFQRPQRASTAVTDKMASQARPGKREATPPQLNLRATLLSNRIPLVNVDGYVLAVGDEIEGYQLTAITEGGATFTKGKRRLTLTIGAKELDQDK